VNDKLVKGGDWTKLAKEYSDDPGSKDNGGLYENQEARNWVAEFKAASLKQPINQVGDPVKTEYGYHVMKVEKREPQALDKVKDELKQEAAQNKLNDFMANELPKLITKIDLPQEAAPETGGGTTNEGTTNQDKTDTSKDNATESEKK
jgi:foldase protein PrsA